MSRRSREHSRTKRPHLKPRNVHNASSTSVASRALAEAAPLQRDPPVPSNSQSVAPSDAPTAASPGAAATIVPTNAPVRNDDAAGAEPNIGNETGKNGAEEEGIGTGEAISIHPLAEVFPIIGENHLHELADDIKQNGLLEPINLYHGKILDGRCRYFACRIAGVEPKFMEYPGEDPVGYVLRKNALRRHLTESQRALVAAKLADMNVGANQYTTEGLPIGRAAKLLNVSERSVARAKEVLRLGDSDLVKEVERGELAISVAAKKCRPPELEQGELEANHEGKRDTTAPAQTVVAAGETPTVGGLNDPSTNGVNTELPAIEPVGNPPIAPTQDGADPPGDASAQQSVNAPDDAAFDALVAAWAAASETVRHRFVIEVVEPFGQSNIAA